MHNLLLLTLCGLLLAGCEQLGIEDPAKLAAAREAEGRAIGSGCRHSGRPLEECYSLNKRASKAAIFTGWRDMDAYMRENNIEIIPPEGPAPAKAAGKGGQETPGKDGTPEPGAAPESKAKATPSGLETLPPTKTGKGRMV